MPCKPRRDWDGIICATVFGLALLGGFALLGYMLRKAWN